MNPDIFHFWAKTSDNKDGRWHSVLCHSIDVGCVAAAILEKDKRLSKLLCQALKLKENDLIQFISVYSSLHDLGKISSVFQRQPGVSKSMNSWISESIYPYTLKERTEKGSFTPCYRHEQITHYLLGQDGDELGIINSIVDADIKIKSELSCIHSLHHGKYNKHLCPGDFPFPGSFDTGGPDTGRWRAAQTEMATFLFETFRPSKIPFRIKNLSKKACAILTGLIIESDWIASDQKSFPLQFSETEDGTLDVNAYLLKSRLQAKAIIDLFVLHEQYPSKKPSFHTLFPEIAIPNNLQKMIIDLAEEKKVDFSKQFFMMINFPMGKGKTEAAIYASELAGKGELFCLPSQATTNSIYKRRIACMDNKLKGSGTKAVVEISHSMRFFSSERSDLYERKYKEGSMSSSFFSSTKKALLAPYCVATLDQAAVASLLSKHMYLRHYAMAGKTVIIDEVHSYGVYTQEFIFGLIEWLKELGCNVVILSATIAAEHKIRLTEAWGRNLSDEQAKIYPSLIIIPDKKPILVEKIESDKRIIELEKVKGSSFEDSLQIAIKNMEPLALEPNFTAAIFCNTVEETQKTYDIVKAQLHLDDNELVCLHSKMPLFQGKDVEEVLDKRLGTKGASLRQGRMIVIASQKCEQSLNFDCDYMISFLCPIDSLLQRLGRLHRFSIPRPKGCETARATIIDSSNYSPAFGKSSTVYDSLILRRTSEILSKKKNIVIPEQMQDMVDVVYKPFNPSESIPLEKDQSEYEACQMNARIHARELAVRPIFPTEIDKLYDYDDESSSEPDGIREILPSRRIILIFKGKNGKFYSDWDFKNEISIAGDLNFSQIKTLAKNAVSIYTYQFAKCSEHSGEKGYGPWTGKMFLNKCFPEFFVLDDRGRLVTQNGRMLLCKRTGLKFLLE